MATSKSFSSTASHVMNELPTHVSFALTLPVFRRHLKHHSFLDAYPGFTTPTIKIECHAVHLTRSSLTPTISFYILGHVQMLRYLLTYVLLIPIS